MKISLLAIEQISPFIVDIRKGKEIVKLFNNFGIKDVYDDDLGMPDIGKKNGQRPSKTQYVNKRLADINNSNNLRELINLLIKENPEIKDLIEKILHEEGFGIENVNGEHRIQGGIILNPQPIVNEAHFQDIQNKILAALDKANVSIIVVMAWFTNEKLFQKLVEKHQQGIDVKLAIYDDGINKKHGVNVDQLPNIKIKRGLRGGLMHNKFCVIDNQIVITGSYNWSDNAEFKNDENVTIEYDPKQATNYSVEYRRLTS